MVNIQEINNFLNACEQELRKISPDRRNKVKLLEYQSKLKSVTNTVLLIKNKSTDNDEIALCDKAKESIDTLLFITDSLIDYYEERVSEK